ncbi:MAG: hypothetical protein QOG28_5622 [Trebonia sp.]|nr:hypothetical protein [Trebonia sp.]
MTAAIIGLIGAVFGAVAAMAGSALSDRRQMRQEDIRWRRDQRVAAYEGALRHLLRAANMRSRFLADGGTVITQEDQREWFGDLAEAQFWLHALIGRCESAQSARLEDTAQKLDDAISSMNAGRGLAKKPGDVIKALDEAVAAVSKCSQLYMSPGATVGSDSAAVSGPVKADT